MSEYDFWHCDPRAYKAYRKLYRLKKQSGNEDMFVLGNYIFDAFETALSNAMQGFSKHPKSPEPYRKAPYDLYVDKTPEQIEEEEEKKKQLETDRVKASLMALQRNFKK